MSEHKRKYELDEYRRGHEWATNDDGSVDFFGYDVEYCNGPRCVRCGYAFCEHCFKEIPQEDCIP